MHALCISQDMLAKPSHTYGGELSMQTTLAMFPECDLCLKRQPPYF